MSEGWARVRNVFQCCDFTVIFGGGTLVGGGGIPDLIHAYVRWGVPLDLKMHGCMGHIESKIQNLKGLLRVLLARLPY